MVVGGVIIVKIECKSAQRLRAIVIRNIPFLVQLKRLKKALKSKKKHICVVSCNNRLFYKGILHSNPL
jgi:hypothetical protein